MSSSNIQNRIPELDSFRGIAAFVVVLAHISHYFPSTVYFPNQELFEEYWRTVLSGRLAVLIFFCISGFVLSYPYFSGTKPVYKLLVDILNRLPRLFIPIFLTGVFCFTLQYIAVGWVDKELYAVYSSPEWVRRWSVSDWAVIDAIKFLIYEVLFGYDRSHSFNINLWTMPVEFAYSMLVFACVALINRKYILCLILSLIWLALLLCWQDEPNIVLLRLIDGCQFGTGVFAAWLVSKHRLLTLRFTSNVNFMLSCFVGGIAFSIAGGLLRREGLLIGFLVDHIAAVLVFVSFFYYFGRSSWLQNRVCRLLGYISFQLYLIHGAVLYFLFSLTVFYVEQYTILVYLSVCVLSILVSISISYALTAKFEVPIVRIVRRYIANELTGVD